MKLTRLSFPFSNQRGFTLVELMMVMGIIGMLSAIGIQQVKFNRENAYDRQSQASMRNLLTAAAIDVPQGGDTAGQGGDLGFLGYPDLEIPVNVYWSIDNDGADRWRIYFAHPAGRMGYYFWVPGDAYGGSLDTDGSGNRSDKIFYDDLPNSYRKAANGSLP
jgi:prepilin-type N-terminal cleavage/methylation domain-containing protein